MAPRSPEQRLQRLLFVARIDALSLVIVAGPALLVALALREWPGAGAGAAITLGAALEWGGQRALRRREGGGLSCLLAAQILCLAAILTYVGLLARAPRADHLLALLPSFTKEQLRLVFPDPTDAEQFLLSIERLMLAAVALAAVLYQGGLLFYYARARRLVAAWTGTPPLLGPPPLPGRR